MFASRYYADRYYAPRYFPKVGAVSTGLGAGKRFMLLGVGCWLLVILLF